ncbi:hypothetical protein, partial [Bacteroides sp. 51]|uniref:hypothetical protein n=1 Tax=Bacteroides sp. 51 TaxID=2302938 RepID=UPI0019402DD0
YFIVFYFLVILTNRSFDIFNSLFIVIIAIIPREGISNCKFTRSPLFSIIVISPLRRVTISSNNGPISCYSKAVRTTIGVPDMLKEFIFPLLSGFIEIL